MMMTKSSTYVPGAIIVGAGPSGLAAAACLKQRNIPSIVLERSNCIASLWQLKTYDRLRLHLPKQFCELPLMPFPDEFPTYPSKKQFIDYLERYAKKFAICPIFYRAVVCAEWVGEDGLWEVRDAGGGCFVARWLVVATGENAEAEVPEIEGMDGYNGEIMHASCYKNGGGFGGKSVLVVGCGNSGMEICLDLFNYNAFPTIAVRNTVHILPREILGRSTFGLSAWLLKWLPLNAVDALLLIVSRFLIGNTAKYGLRRPETGPLELKNSAGKTPVLDVGTLSKIKTGHIQVRPGIQRLTPDSVVFSNGKSEKFDAVILATGYKSNVPGWLKEKEMFSESDGLPKRPFPNGWKGENGLYAVGFTKRGLLGASMDAKRIAEDIEKCFKSESN